MLKVKNINYRVNKKFSLSDISFNAADGYLTCLLGKNGAGKTTLMNLLYGCLFMFGMFFLLLKKTLYF